MSQQSLLRPPAAAEYLRERYGYGSPRSLAKWRTIGGGPVFRKISRLVVYSPADLDAWAQSKLSAGMRSTSEYSHAKTGRPRSAVE